MPFITTNRPASAEPNLTLTFTQKTGLGHFDVLTPGQTRRPGQDVGPDDDIIRTNDIVTYSFSAGTPVTAPLAVTNPVATITLPRGEQFVNMVAGNPTFTDPKGNYNVTPPAFCQPGSTIAYSTGTTMPAPDHAALTSTSWQNLPQQTLTCQLKNIGAGEGIGFTLYSKVRPEVPDGTVLGPVTLTITGDEIGSETTVPLTKTATQGSKWDLSINGSKAYDAQNNSDFVKQNTEQACSQNYGAGTGPWQGSATGNAQQLCYVGGFGVTLAQPNAGLGGTPIQDGNFTYTIDLSPQSIWSRPAVTGGPSIWQAVQDHNAANPTSPIVLPGGYTNQNTGGTGWVYESANSNLLPAPDTSTTVDNSVRKSGNTTIAQMTDYVPGNTVTYSVSGADTTAYTVPRYAGAPANQPVWSERGYVYTSRVFIEVPLTVVSQNFAFFDGLDGATDGRVSLPIAFIEPQDQLSYTSVSGLTAQTTNSHTEANVRRANNYRFMRTGFVNDIAVRNQWTSPAAQGDNSATPLVVEGPSTATSPQRYWPGNPAIYGPSGEASIYKGDGVAVDGESVLSALILEGRTYMGGGTLMCQSFDNREVVVDPAVARATKSGGLQIQNIDPLAYPKYSDVRAAAGTGGATWIYGSMYQYTGPSGEAPTGAMAVQSGMGDRYTDFQVRYGVGDPTDKTCEGAVTWYTADQINAGIIAWEDVNKVEVYLELMPGGNVAEQRTNVSIGMRVLNNAPATLIETNVQRTQQWFTTKYGGQNASNHPLGNGIDAGTLRTVAYPNGAAGPNTWNRVSTYDEVANNAGSSSAAMQGDRLTHVDALARVDKKVQSHLGDRPFVETDRWTPNDSQHIATQPPSASDINGEYEPLTAPPIYAPNSTFAYEIKPSIDANPMPETGTMIRDVLVEDCLPTSIRLDPAQDLVLNGWVPYLAGALPYQKTPMDCAAGEVYVAFYQPQVDVSVPLKPITIPVYVLGTAMSGSRVNQTEISLMTNSRSPKTDADPSLFTQRADRARIEIQAPDGLRVAKSTTTPLIFVDDLLNVSNQNVSWEMVARNINSGRVISDVDLIDYLPEDGLNGSNYLGEKNFVSASVTTGDNVEVYFTKATVSPKTVDALIQWSDPDSPSNQAGGSTVWCNEDNTATFPAGGDLSQCPQSPAEVTGVRAFRPGVFVNGASFTVHVEMSAEDRVGENTPANTVTMYNRVTMRAEGLDVPLYSEASARWINRDVPPNPGSISGHVWDDYNNNGIVDPGEPPIAGVEVSATGVPMWCSQKFEDPSVTCPEVTLYGVTNANGDYTIVGVYPGLLKNPNGSVLGPREPYVVEFTTPDGYTTTVRRADVVGGSLAPSTEVELNADVQYVTDINGGYFKPGALEVTKNVADATTGNPVSSAAPGQEVTYTVKVRNTDPLRHFTTDHPAAFVDSLADVLDDADLVNGPTVTSGSGTAAISGDDLTWTGPLAPDETATVTYTVKVHGEGSGVVTNIVVTGDEPGFPAPGDCQAPSCASTSTPVFELPSVNKSVSVNGAVGGTANVGDTIEYTVTIRNESTTAYTAEHPAAVVDDLTDVLLVAEPSGTPTASAGTATIKNGKLVWVGPIPADGTVTVTYAFTVTSSGDLSAVNLAFAADGSVIDPDTGLPIDPGTGEPVTTPDPDSCVSPHCDSTTTVIRPVPDMEITKAATIDGEAATQVEEGDTVDFTVTVTNLSETHSWDADYPANFMDDLTGVLDDAELVGEPVASAGTVTLNGNRLEWSGPLPAGGSVTVTYSVKVKTGGDQKLVNIAFLAPPGPLDPDTPTPPTCDQKVCSGTLTEVLTKTPPTTPTTTPTTTPSTPDGTTPSVPGTPPSGASPSSGSSPSGLPRTGAEVARMVLLALLLTGTGVVVLRSRRRQTT